MIHPGHEHRIVFFSAEMSESSQTRQSTEVYLIEPRRTNIWEQVVSLGTAHWRSWQNLLSRVLDSELLGHPRAGSRRTSTDRLDAKDLAQPPSGTLARRQLQPCHGTLALLALWRVRRGRQASILGSRNLAQVVQRLKVHVEVGRVPLGKEVNPADKEVRRC